MHIIAQKLISGLIAGLVGGLIFGLALGFVTMFVGTYPGLVLGFALGFRWGFRRVGSEECDPDTGVSTPLCAGDTALLIVGFFGCLWLTFAVHGLFFGYSGPFKGHPIGSILLFAGMALSPFVPILLEKFARRQFGESLRNVLGLASLVLFLVLVVVWWNWAVARDQGPARPARRSAVETPFLERRPTV